MTLYYDELRSLEKWVRAYAETNGVLPREVRLDPTRVPPGLLFYFAGDRELILLAPWGDVRIRLRDTRGMMSR